MLGNGFKQAVLIAEQAVDRRRLHAGLLRDPARGHGRRPLLLKQAGGDINDPRLACRPGCWSPRSCSNDNACLLSLLLSMLAYHCYQ